MTLLVVLDLGVATLLLVTIGFCVVLNRKLAALRRNESELAAVLLKFNDAASRAEIGIARLKEEGGEATATLRERIGEARALCDDLAFMVERGGKIATDLGAKPARPAQTTFPPAQQKNFRAPSAPSPAAPSAPILSKAERELIAALDAAR